MRMMTVTNEATTEQWKALYKAADKVRKLEPWKQFWDTDIIEVKADPATEPVYFSIMGAAGSRCGFSAFESREALANFFRLAMHDKLNIPEDFAMALQTNLTCFESTGDHERLSEDRRKVLRHLGIRHRAKDKYLYFASLRERFRPENLNADEVIRLKRYCELLKDAIEYYRNSHLDIHFETGELYVYRHTENGVPVGGSEPLTSTFPAQKAATVIDLAQVRAMRDRPSINGSIQIDATILPGWIDLPETDRPCVFIVALVVDRANGLILGNEVLYPTQPIEQGIGTLMHKFIQAFGRPHEVEYTNALVGRAISHICAGCGIKLTKTLSMPEMEAAEMSLKMSTTV